MRQAANGDLKANIFSLKRCLTYKTLDLPLKIDIGFNDVSNENGFPSRMNTQTPLVFDSHHLRLFAWSEQLSSTERCNTLLPHKLSPLDPEIHMRLKSRFHLSREQEGKQLWTSDEHESWEDNKQFAVLSRKSMKHWSCHREIVHLKPSPERPSSQVSFLAALFPFSSQLIPRVSFTSTDKVALERDEI